MVKNKFRYGEIEVTNSKYEVIHKIKNITAIEIFKRNGQIRSLLSL